MYLIYTLMINDILLVWYTPEDMMLFNKNITLAYLLFFRVFSVGICDFYYY